MMNKALVLFFIFLSLALWSQDGNVNWNKINTVEKAQKMIENLNSQLKTGELNNGEIRDSLKKYRIATETQIETFKDDYTVSDSERLKWYEIYSIISKKENEYLANALSVFAGYLKDLEKQDKSTSEKLNEIENELVGFGTDLSEYLDQIEASYNSIETGFAEYNEIIATQRELIQELLKQKINSSSKSTMVIGPGFTNGLNNPSIDISVGYLQHVGFLTMGGIIDFGVKSNLEMPINIGARLLLGISIY